MITNTMIPYDKYLKSVDHLSKNKNGRSILLMYLVDNGRDMVQVFDSKIKKLLNLVNYALNDSKKTKMLTAIQNCGTELFILVDKIENLANFIIKKDQMLFSETHYCNIIYQEFKNCRNETVKNFYLFNQKFQIAETEIAEKLKYLDDQEKIFKDHSLSFFAEILQNFGAHNEVLDMICHAETVFAACITNQEKEIPGKLRSNSYSIQSAL